MWLLCFANCHLYWSHSRSWLNKSCMCVLIWIKYETWKGSLYVSSLWSWKLLKRVFLLIGIVNNNHQSISPFCYRAKLLALGIYSCHIVGLTFPKQIIDPWQVRLSEWKINSWLRKQMESMNYVVVLFGKAFNHGVEMGCMTEFKKVSK